MNFNSKLSIISNDKVIFETSDTQRLYLYPLTLKDYVVNLKNLLPIKLDIIKLDNTIDYKELLNNKYFNNLLCVEININDKKDIDLICDIVKHLYIKKIKVSLNIKNIIYIPLYFFKSISKYITYFKIHFNYDNYDKFNKRLKVINNNKKNESLIHIKSYLKLEKINNYEKYIIEFKKYNVNIYQLSKELLPINKTNITIDNKYEDIIRKLENKYSNGSIVFKSVKNLRELYYPRFELDDRNTRNCYACKLKPYLYGNIVLPCKVNEVIDNFDKWGINDFNNLNNFRKCGTECSDCASIYENDMLDRINKIIKDKSVVVKEE